MARVLGHDDLVLDREGRPYALRRAQESELPLELRLGFIDGESDYRTAAVLSRRLAGAARRELGVETPIVTRAAEGQRLADRRLQEIWAGRETLDLELSPDRLDLEPGDVVALVVEEGKAVPPDAHRGRCDAPRQREGGRARDLSQRCGPQPPASAAQRASPAGPASRDPARAADRADPAAAAAFARRLCLALAGRARRLAGR